MRRSIRLAAAVASLLAVAPVARAQTPAADANPWIHVTKVDVNPGSAAEFEDYVKKIQAGRVKLGLPNAVGAWQMVMGGSTYEYHFVVPFAKWEEMDANPSIGAILARAYGDVEGAKILKAGRSTIRSATVEVYRTRLDLSTNVKPGAPTPAFVTLTITEHHQETMPAYIRLLGKIKRAEEMEPNTPEVTRFVLNVGEGSVTIAARGSKTLAERMTFPNQPALLSKAYGAADAAEMGELINKTIKSRRTVIMASRPDLSSPGK